MWFITSVIVVSAFGLPAVMCHASIVSEYSFYSVFLSFIYLDSSGFNGFHNGG
jgi:hypothetical protein